MWKTIMPQEKVPLPMWMTTPDGREGWSDLFLRKGHSVWRVRKDECDE